MVEHLSVEAFLGGLLLGGIVARFGVGFRTYWIWGKGRNTIEADLRRAQVNEAAAQAREAATLIEAEQDRAKHERSSRRHGRQQRRMASRIARSTKESSRRYASVITEHGLKQCGDP